MQYATTVEERAKWAYRLSNFIEKERLAAARAERQKRKAEAAALANVLPKHLDPAWLNSPWEDI